jgi:hypothetical protein
LLLEKVQWEDSDKKREGGERERILRGGEGEESAGMVREETI